ncbi:NAD-dependent epimerase/dehydratase family protein [Acinetobacter tandoii]|nr:NAD-dependent epimerase/dehydratase family protein [Acinetobacter tandoii]
MINPIQKAIVIGATGLVGRALIKQLNELASCEQITAVVRHYDVQLSQMEKVHQFVLEDFLMLNDEDIQGHTHAYSCLGSTLKKAGSKAQFYNIDYEINAHFADLLEEKEIHYLLVSALGANPKSPIFYNRVKGELEQHICELALYKTSILQPSLLLGERSEQRVLEGATQRLYQKMSHLVPDSFKYKPVTAEQVAHTMVVAAQSQTEKFEIYDNLRIQKAK